MKARPLSDKEAEFLRESTHAITEICTSDIDELRAAIAEAAYYRAEQRGFTPGDELLDWVEAEREIKSMWPQASGRAID